VKVTVANNGQEALLELGKKSFDIVLMDVQMPVMDGYEATRHIRATPELSSQCVIAMTANAMAEDRQRCLSAGMDDFITKPIMPELLYQTLAKWVTTSITNPVDDDFVAVTPKSAVIAPDKENLDKEKPADSLNLQPKLDTTAKEPSREPSNIQPKDQTKGDEPEQDKAADDKSIDLSYLKQIAFDDPVKVRKFALIFLESAMETLAEMEKAFIKDDVKSISQQGHKLKSSARAIGATDLAEKCEIIEKAGKVNDLATIENLLPELALDLHKITLQIKQAV
jgi:two-component system sensor histidine kinase/response regulator